MAEPSVGISAAISAYGKAARGAETPSVAPSGNGQDGEFAGLVRAALEQAREIGGTAERASLAGMSGQADIGQVVTAVAEAEVALQTVVTIRDKVIESYKEIVKMPM